MIGAYDFCGHYEWTFAWLAARGGEAAVRDYWDRAIHRDSQRHAFELIAARGFDGMRAYWAHTLQEEAAGFKTTSTDSLFRIDMHQCPSKGFLLRNGLRQYPDYCDHCIGWIGPMLERAGYTIDHEHNHRGQCWWEFRAKSDLSRPGAPGALSGAEDVRTRDEWRGGEEPIDRFTRASAPGEKRALPPSPER